MEIHVSRDNESIGKFDEKSIREGLSYGNLLPSDMFFHEGIKEWKSLGSEFPEQSSNDEFVGIKGWLLVFCLFLIVTPFLELLTANLDYNEILDFSEITEEQFEDYKSNPDGWDDTELLDNYVYRTWFQNWIMAPVFFAGTILGILIFFKIPKIKLAILIYLIISWIVDTIWCIIDSTVQIYLIEAASFTMSITWTLLTAFYAAWFIYILKSKRVKHTLS